MEKFPGFFCDKKERQVPKNLPAFSLEIERPSAPRLSCNTNMSLKSYSSSLKGTMT
jgi:hypothetical protein